MFAANVSSASLTCPGIGIPPGRYDFSEFEYSFNYDRSAPVNVGIRATVGEFFGGDLVTVRPSIRARYR